MYIECHSGKFDSFVCNPQTVEKYGYVGPSNLEVWNTLHKQRWPEGPLPQNNYGSMHYFALV